MGQVVVIDWEKPLLFNCDPWTITTWPGDATKKGVKSNVIGHSQSTSWSLTAKFEYIKINYMVSSETSYDKFRLTIDGVVKVNIGTTTGTYETTFTDGLDHVIKFEYYKDGSGSTGYDSVMIDYMAFSTVDDAMVYDIERFLIKDVNGGIYHLVDSIPVIIPNALVGSQLFLDLGNTRVEMSSDRWLSSLDNPTILYFNDQGETTKVPRIKLSVYPFDQVIITEVVDVSDETILGIQNFNLDCDGNIKVWISLDDGVRWQVFNSTSLVWEVSEIGMSKEVFNGISSAQWNLLFDVKKNYKFKIVMDETTVLRRLTASYVN